MTELFEALRIVVRPSPRGVCLDLSGDVDMAAADLLRDGLMSAIASGQSDVELDMSATTCCDSVGPCAILVARRRLAEQGRHRRIVGASPPVLGILELSGTRELLARAVGPAVGPPRRPRPAGCGWPSRGRGLP